MATTKKEIEAQCNREIKSAKEKLEAIEIQHAKFKDEDALADKNRRESDRIAEEVHQLEEQAYSGNWESYDAWYHGKIPDHFKFEGTEFNENAFKKALTEIYDETLHAIKGTQKYRDLNQNWSEVTGSVCSEKHEKIHEIIRDLEHTVDWNERRIRRIQDRSELIKVCKWIAEEERRNAKRQAEEEATRKFKIQIKKYKEEIKTKHKGTS